MSAQRGAVQAERSRAVRPASGLGGRWPLLARLAWGAVALLSFTFFIWGIPDYFASAKLFWFTTDPPPAAVVREGFDHLGVSPGVYAGYGLALYVFRAAVFYLASVMLFRRAPNDRIALLVAILLVALPVGDNDPQTLQDIFAAEPVRGAIGMIVGSIAFILVLSLIFLFPDGHFRPRWTVVVSIAWLLAGLGAFLLPGSSFDMLSWPGPLSVGFIPACVVLAVSVQIWRYRRISSPVERQQTKWFALGLAIVLTEFAITTTLIEYEPIAWPAASPARVVLTDFVLSTVHFAAFLSIPLTLSVAVLRYRLWDIDRLINRALVYGSLTAALAGVYLVSALLIGGLARAATGERSNLAVAGATLATAALIRPLRRRLQATIDRRFYRHKYDAARTVAAFGAALRVETDLERIQADLLAVVEETMQPAHVSLWLRSDALR